MGAGNLEDLAFRLEEAALKAGAEEAEAIVRLVRSVRVEVSRGAVEGVRRTDETSAALRVIVEGRPGFAFSTIPDSQGITAIARDAVMGSRLVPPEEGNRFSDAAAFGPVEGLVDREGLDRPFEDKIALAGVAEDAAFQTDPRISKVHKPACGQHHRVTVIASGGEVWSYEDSTFSVSVQAIAESDGESQTAFEYRASRRLSDLDPVGVGRVAALEAAGLLGGGPPRSGTFPALFPPKTALDLLGVLAFSFSAEEMQKGRSRLAGRKGEEVFSRLLNIIDDGSMPWMTGSVPFDDERVVPVPRRLVESGVVTGALHTLKTAAVAGEDPTGNGFRASLASVPLPSSSNLFIEPGLRPVEEVLPAGRTVKVMGLMGAHTMDRVSGDFSLGVSGFMLEGGEVAGSFRNGTVSGNLFSLLESLTAVGDDLFFYGSMGSPSLLFPSVVIAGS